MTILFYIVVFTASNTWAQLITTSPNMVMEDDDECNCTCPNPIMEELGNIATGAAVASAVSLPVGMVAGGGALYLAKTCASKFSLSNLAEVSPLEDLELPSLELDMDQDDDEEDEKMRQTNTSKYEDPPSRTDDHSLSEESGIVFDAAISPLEFI